MKIYDDDYNRIIELDEAQFNKVTQHCLPSRPGLSPFIKFMWNYSLQRDYLSETLDIEVVELVCGKSFKLINIDEPKPWLRVEEQDV